MNELDLLLAELVEAARQRRQGQRSAARPAKPGRINLARHAPRSSAAPPAPTC